jgi:hypothetical protein
MTPWTIHEDVLLLTLMENREIAFRWKTLSTYFNQRTGSSLKCRYYLLKQGIQKRGRELWKPEEDALLLELMKNPKLDHEWELLSREFAARAGNQQTQTDTNHGIRQRSAIGIRHRYELLRKSFGMPRLRDYWKPEEDALLSELLENPEMMKNPELLVPHFQGRSASAIMSRCYSIKNRGTMHKWTPEEEARLIQLVAKSKDWESIAAQLGSGRKGTACRIRWERLHYRLKVA